MKAFVITDIHSYYGLMTQALKRVGFEEDNPEHIIINCGDSLDRGPKSYECLTFLNKMHQQGRAYLVKGNHEELLEQLLQGKRSIGSHDFSNGTVKTIRQLYKSIYGERVKLKDLPDAVNKLNDSKTLSYYLSNLNYYYEFKDYIFVHGWVPYRAGKADLSYTEGWQRAIWENGMQDWSYGITVPDKTIVCGHWHTSWGHTYLHNVGVAFPEDVYTTYESDPCDHIMHTEPFIDKGIIALDACTAYSHKVNVYVIENFEEQLLC